jgi:hypothetical protein
LLIVLRKNGKARNVEKQHRKQLDDVNDELLTTRALMTRQAKFIHEAREYQLDLLERAKKENTIAVLETGKPDVYFLSSPI